jgi:hypothetical protein
MKSNKNMHLIIGLSVVFCLSSCLNRSKHPVIANHDIEEQHNDSDWVMLRDTLVRTGLQILNWQAYRDSGYKCSRDEGFPCIPNTIVVFNNRSNTEKIICQQGNGYAPYDFTVLRIISIAHSFDTACLNYPSCQLNTEKFTTTRGLCIGINKTRALEVFGSCDSIFINGKYTTFFYGVDDWRYYREIYFNDDSICVGFEFGEVAP